MAGISWIKLETTFPRKPVVLIVASALGLDANTVIGALVTLLCWADGVVEDGRFGFNDTTIIDHITNCNGLGEALIKAGWIVTDEEGNLCLNHWNVHNGECAKKRAQRARRNEKYNDKNKTQAVLNQDIIKTQQSLTHSDNSKTQQRLTHSDNSKTQQRPLDKIREDKNIEEVITPTPRPKKRNEIIYAGATTIIPEDGHNIEFLDAFGKQPKDPRAFMINWKAALDEVKDGALLVEAAKIAIQRMIEREGDTTFLQAPEYWLGDRKYRDYLSQSKRAVQVTVNKFKVNYED